jgi:hypothetical protein
METEQQQTRPFFVALFVVFLIVIMAGLLMPAKASTGKPTPMIRAYWRCRDYARFVQFASTNDHFTLDISKLTDKRFSSDYQTGDFLRLLISADDLAKRGENYLIRTNCSTAESNRAIVIVCEKSFDYDEVNRSFWNLFKRNHAHAVGYSDGKVGLISPTEFTKLDLRGFTDLSQMATNALAVYFEK